MTVPAVAQSPALRFWVKTFLPRCCRCGGNIVVERGEKRLLDELACLHCGERQTLYVSTDRRRFDELEDV